MIKVLGYQAGSYFPNILIKAIGTLETHVSTVDRNLPLFNGLNSTGICLAQSDSCMDTTQVYSPTVHSEEWSPQMHICRTIPMLPAVYWVFLLCPRRGLVQRNGQERFHPDTDTSSCDRNEKPEMLW